MKLDFVLPMILVVFINVGDFQRLTPLQMNNTLTYYKGKETKCHLTLRSQWYPEIRYAYYWCQQLLPVNNSLAMNYPNLNSCSGFDCWESQLTDVSRFDIMDIMNRYRQKVAAGNCKQWCTRNNRKVIFELRWSSYLEKKAIIALKNCPRQNWQFDNVVTDHPYYGHLVELFNHSNLNVTEETVVVSFATRTGLQREMRLILWKLMEENRLRDWNESTSAFRRGLMFDVGCAYVVRHGVENYMTALDEKVKYGNIGYLACLFMSIHMPINSPAIGFDTDRPSLVACQQSLPVLRTLHFGEASGYFPLLCTIQIDVLDVTQNPDCEPLWREDICKFGKPSSNITWKEKLYGTKVLASSAITERIEDCYVPENIPKPTNQGDNYFNYNCTLKQEVFMDADPTFCSNWNCRDSQLTDVTKVMILNNLNAARHLVANGECSPECPHPCDHCNRINYCDMTSLRWHWFLEWKASEIVRNCPTDYVCGKEVEFEDGPFHDPVVYEQITLLFHLPANEGQLALGKTLSRLFWQNAFCDWNNHLFKRANAFWIGCAIVLRPNIELDAIKPELRIENGIATHMVCIYAALSQAFSSIRDFPSDHNCCAECDKISSTIPCWAKFSKNVPPYANLCTSNLLEITMSCQAESCNDRSTSKAWETTFEGLTAYQEVNGDFRAKVRVPRSPPTVMPKPPYRPWALIVFHKYCSILIMFYLMLLALLCCVLSLIFKYKVEKSKFENNSE